MSIAKSFAVSLIGLAGDRVTVETHIASGLPGLTITGLPDASIGEARDRLRAALQSTGCALPPDRVTVNLAPAAIRKQGSGFDLAIAISVLAAKGTIDGTGPAQTVHVGELGLDGSVRAVPGVLPIVSWAAKAGFTRVMVPAASVGEASLVSGIEIIAVSSLRQAAVHYGADAAGLADEPGGTAVPTTRRARAQLGSRTQAQGGVAHSPADLADVVGNREAVRALLIAAAGGHHFLMVGPPGAGKTMLAQRMIDVLPDLDVERSIEVAAVRSLRGLPVSEPLDRRPPLHTPHHTASKVALLGGGSGTIRPGAVTLATNGVLFLDEAPEFPRDVLDSLRESLETGVHEVHRSSGVAQFPAKYQLVLAANPCPCGYAGSRERACSCPPSKQRSYFDKLSGPLLDRIDLQLRVERVSSALQRVALAERAAGESNGMTTADARARVERARSAAAERLAATPWRTNAEVAGRHLRTGPLALPPRELVELDRAMDVGQLTMRGYVKVLRVAWSIADLAGRTRPCREDVMEALYYRTTLLSAVKVQPKTSHDRLPQRRKDDHHHAR